MKDLDEIKLLVENCRESTAYIIRAELKKIDNAMNAALEYAEENNINNDKYTHCVFTPAEVELMAANRKKALTEADKLNDEYIELFLALLDLEEPKYEYTALETK